MNAGNISDYCWSLSSFGFLRPDLKPWGYTNRCFLVALCHLTVRILNLEVATMRLLHQHVKTPGQFHCHVAHESVSLQLFLRSLGVICRGRSVISEGHKIASRIEASWTHSLPFCFWPIFNLMNYGHIIKRKP